MEIEITHLIPPEVEFVRESYTLNDLGVQGKVISVVMEEIDMSKSKLDHINVPDKESLLSVFNYLQDRRRDIAKRIASTRNKDNLKVNNSFLKGIEILAKYKIPELYEKIVALDTAAIPGHYIFALNYYVNHILSEPKQLTWYGCFDEKNQYQKDLFLIKNKCAKKWLATSNFTDIRVIDAIVNYARVKNINLIMADLAIDTSDNYNDQEGLFMKYVVAQILVAVQSLSKGGSMFIKQFSCFKPFTLCYMYCLSGMFDKFYIYKPVSSKPQNSELFMVGIGFKFPGAKCINDDEKCCNEGNCKRLRKFVSYMQGSLHFNTYDPFISKEILIEFIEKIKKLYFELSTEQIKYLEQMYEMLTSIASQGNELDRQRLADSYRKQEGEIIRKKEEEFENIVQHRFENKVNTFHIVYE